MPTLAEILNKRYQYETLISTRKRFNLPSLEGDIDSLKYFINNGYKSNRFRKNYKAAYNLANEILEYYEHSLGLLDSGMERQPWCLRD